MKKLLSCSPLLFLTKLAMAEGNDFTISDAPSGGLFGSSTKIAQMMVSAEWIVKGSAGLFAIACFVSAGNLARQGEYGRAGGAVVGGVISSIGAYLVHLSQS